MTEKRYKAIIVDDEELARSDLKALLAQFPSVEVIGEAENIRTATEAIEKLNPDLIFLDIQFPGESGFELLEKIDTPAKIIFVTAFDEFAIRAFEVNAQDYLLKPVNPERLKLTLEHLETDQSIAELKMLPFNYDDSIFLELNNKYHFLKVNTIVIITSAGNYSEIVTTRRLNGLTSKSMREWEGRLPKNSFARIHRSTIINIEFVEKIEQWFNYSYRVYLKGVDKPVIMSRRYASKIKERMR
jgi:two-component system LytT family response regulator